jgi:hypothetical protein
MPKITELPELTAPSTDDVLPIVDSGVTKKVTVTNLLAGRAALVHTHNLADLNEREYTSLVNIPLTFAPAAHTHAIGLVDLAANTAAQALATNLNTRLQITANTTLTTTVPPAGTQGVVILVQPGTTTRTVTFGTGFKPSATVVMGTVAARQFVVSFVSDGTNLIETGRTAAIPT